MRLLLLLVIGLLTGGGALACSYQDMSNPLGTRPVTVGNPTEPGDDDDDGAPTNSLSADGGSSSGSSGSSGTTSGGPNDAAPPPNLGAFVGAPAYVSTLGATTRKTQHNFAGNVPTTNPAGRPCLQCHGAAGPAPRFAFAGTIYKTGTTPAPRVEVRIIDANNKAASTYTDDDGNYFIPFATTGALAFPAKAGARDADTTKLMKDGSMNGNCNNCHRTGGTSTPLVVQ